MDICAFSDELVEYAKVHKMQDLSILPTVEGMTLIFSKSYYRQMYRKVTAEDAQQLITRFKFLGGMEVGEKRRAQLGAISYPLADGEQRIRVSTVGDFQGQESLVLRFLHPLGKFHRFFMNEQYEIIADACRYRGLYLFSGPTGSGKSTLMYRLASAAAGQVITIEDPVEIVEPRFLQLQTNPMIGQDYDELIRLSLRHRPELLLIGEIRNKETAKAAIRAALTGHRVFATIHARGLTETIARLQELAEEAAVIDQCLQGIIYQRLLPDLHGVPHALMAYTFYEPHKSLMTWDQALTRIREKEQITHEVFNKEK
ncbi:competence type IV pilus ATPase ComGA [Enterococcus gallinarum]|uniref:competence type IV pilus ATPase ComGA n=1 Tax=Enterococcus gallinarum TaxID=1353 RepID=UPI001D17983B|nr:competence type IV pilus ATPase ComGA [Enterococcus gallinarum]MCC4045314.1 Flp pilus assembly complex ATPase component TadA [Enterococcus gallinarum]